MDRRRKQHLTGGLVAALALVGLAACLPPVGRVAIRQTPAAPQVWDNSDPAVLVDGGRTYLFGSSNNMSVPVRDITNAPGIDASRSEWDRAPRDAMASYPAWANPTTSQIWAPSAIKIGRTYYLYFAARRAGAKADPLNDQCIGRASASSPMGPYTPFPDPIYCGLPAEPGSNPWGRGALDPEVVRAPDGSLSMLVALSRTRDNIGVVALKSGGSVVGGINAQPTILVSQQFPWQDGVDDTRLAATFMENPSMVHDPATQTYLLFYSAGNWWTARYVTGFGRCATPMGPCALDERGPFLKSGSARTGPGGLTAYRASDGTLRVAYATWAAGRENIPSITGANSRQTTLSRLNVTAGADANDQKVWLG